MCYTQNMDNIPDCYKIYYEDEQRAIAEEGDAE